MDKETYDHSWPNHGERPALPHPYNTIPPLRQPAYAHPSASAQRHYAPNTAPPAATGHRSSDFRSYSRESAERTSTDHHHRGHHHPHSWAPYPSQATQQAHSYAHSPAYEYEPPAPSYLDRKIYAYPNEHHSASSSRFNDLPRLPSQHDQFNSQGESSARYTPAASPVGMSPVDWQAESSQRDYRDPTASDRKASRKSSASSSPAPASSSAATRKHECPVCHKLFPRPTGLSTHMNSHTGDQPFKCTFEGCEKRFSVRSNARRHLSTHGVNLKTGPQINADHPSPPSTAAEANGGLLWTGIGGGDQDTPNTYAPHDRGLHRP